MPRLNGIFAAAATPLRNDFTIDGDKLVAHCRWLLEEGGCDGVNLLGTTGEATSFSVAQRVGAMRAVAEAGLPLNRFMTGTGAAALDDAVTLTKAARELGFAGALLLPPFYYKGVRDAALEAYVAMVIERACEGDFGLYLYHIPQISGVPYPIGVVEWLAERFPETLAGIKDSSGDPEHAKALVERVSSIAVFPGAESILAEAPEAGFAGCISATTNINGALVSRGWRGRGTEEGARLLAAASGVRVAISSYPLIAAVKWTLAELHGDEAWRRVHPPLSPLAEADWRVLRERLAGLGVFSGGDTMIG